MKPVVMIGAILALLGLLALAAPEFTTNQSKNVATLGDLKIQANEQTSHTIPTVLSGAVNREPGSTSGRSLSEGIEAMRILTRNCECDSYNSVSIKSIYY